MFKFFFLITALFTFQTSCQNSLEQTGKNNKWSEDDSSKSSSEDDTDSICNDSSDQRLGASCGKCNIDRYECSQTSHALECFERKKNLENLSLISSQSETTVSMSPNIIWAFDFFAITYLNVTQGVKSYYFSKIDQLGNKISDDIQVVDETTLGNYPFISFGSKLVYAETGFGFLFSKNYLETLNGAHTFLQLDLEGDPITEPFTFLKDGRIYSNHVTVSFNNNYFNFVWTEEFNDTVRLHLGKIKYGENILDESLMISEQESFQMNATAFSGNVFGISYIRKNTEESGSFYFGTINEKSKHINNEKLIADFSLWGGSNVLWDGKNFIIAYYNLSADTKVYQIYVVILNESGEKIKEVADISNPNFSGQRPMVVQSNDGYGVLWVEYRGENYIPFMAFFNADFDKTSAPIQITSESDNTKEKAFAWSGKTYATLLWTKNLENNNLMFYQTCQQ